LSDRGRRGCCIACCWRHSLSVLACPALTSPSARGPSTRWRDGPPWASARQGAKWTEDPGVVNSLLGLAFVAAALLGWSAGSSGLALAPSRATPEATLTRPGSRGRFGLRRVGTRWWRGTSGEADIRCRRPAAGRERRPSAAAQAERAGRSAAAWRRLDPSEVYSAAAVPSIGPPPRSLARASRLDPVTASPDSSRAHTV
jgi:hypothetical protein